MLPLLIIVITCVFIGLLSNAIFFWWAIRQCNEKEMENNIPPGVNDPAYEEEIKTRICPCCGGGGSYLANGRMWGCSICKMTGEIPITPEEQRDMREEKMENTAEL